MNSQKKEQAQTLRTNATKEEDKLWYQFLRTYPLQFRRQKIFGQYIVDFFCSEAGLVVELDGGQHYEEDGKEYDLIRSEYLEQYRGFTVLRFSNLDIKEHFEGVCIEIHRMVCKLAPSSGLSEATFPPRGRSEEKLPLGGKLSAELTDEGAGQGEIPGKRPLIRPRIRSATFPPGGRFEKETPMKTVTLYTDGACSGNPGPGGWGAILIYGEHKKEMSGGEKATTNNRMELTAAIRGLQALKEACIVELYSDSKYVIDGLGKGWAKGWRAKGWIKSDKKPALNPDLWGELLDLCDRHTVNLHWVKGHAENPFNNRCDELAVAEWQKWKR